GSEVGQRARLGRGRRRQRRRGRRRRRRGRPGARRGRGRRGGRRRRRGLDALALVVALDRGGQRVAEVREVLLVGVGDRAARDLERLDRVVAVVDAPVALEV